MLEPGNDVAPLVLEALPRLDPTPIDLTGVQAEIISDYWYAISHVDAAFRLEEGHYVLQDWDTKTECLKVRANVLPLSPQH